MNIDYPEWYSVEKQVALTINRLFILNDIIYCLKNLVSIFFESVPTFDFSTFTIYLEDILPLEKDYLLRNQEIDFEAPFSFKEWLLNWKEYMGKSTEKQLRNLPLLFWKYFKKFGSYLWTNIFLKLFDYFSGIILRTYYKNKNFLTR